MVGWERLVVAPYLLGRAAVEQEPDLLRGHGQPLLSVVVVELKVWMNKCKCGHAGIDTIH